MKRQTIHPYATRGLHVGFLIVSLCFLASCVRRYDVEHAPGDLQIVANDSELWMFLEINKSVKRGYIKPVPFGESRIEAYIGHSQEVIILSQTGLVQRIPVAIENGVSFDSSLSQVYRASGGFMLYSGESLSEYPSLFQWQSDRFVLLPRSDVPLEKPSCSDGWSQLYTGDDFVLGSASISWGRKSLLISVQDVPDGFILTIEGQGEDDFERVSLEYHFDAERITRKETEALRTDYERWQTGHCKP